MTTAASKLPPMMTVADFLDWPGDGSGTRYELVDGVLGAMAPASDTHNTIVMTIGRFIGNHLARERPGCRVVGSLGVQPRLRAEWNFRVQDLGVNCSPNRPGEIMTPDPILLVEILSPGNANDTWDNIPHYASLPSVREILAVHSTRVRAEILRREADGSWPAHPAVLEVGATIPLASMGANSSIADFYAGTYLA